MDKKTMVSLDKKTMVSLDKNYGVLGQELWCPWTRTMVSLDKTGFRNLLILRYLTPFKSVPKSSLSISKYLLSTLCARARARVALLPCVWCVFFYLFEIRERNFNGFVDCSLSDQQRINFLCGKRRGRSRIDADCLTQVPQSLAIKGLCLKSI